VKLILPILLVVLVFGLSGCDSAQSGDPLTEEALAGTWHVERAGVRIAGAASVDILSALTTGDEAIVTFGSRGDYTATISVVEPRELTFPGTSVGLTIEGGSFDGRYFLRDNRRMAFTIEGLPGEAVTDYDYRPRTAAPELILSVRMTDEARALIAHLLGSTELAALITGVDLTLRKGQAPN
jgi:hypothetical protein